MDYTATPDQIANVMSSIAGADPQFAAGNAPLAFDASQSADPSATALSLGHADAVTNAQDAVNDQADNGGIMGWVAQHLGHGPVGTALEWMNKPLDEISKDYKFIHAVWTTAGPGAGLLASLGVAGGAAAGYAIGEPAIGADIAGFTERQLLGRTTWQRAYQLSEDPRYQISFGRDLTNLIMGGWITHEDQTHSLLGTLLSGTSDAAFDFAADPLAAAGRFTGALRQGKSLEVGLDETGMASVRSTLPIVKVLPAASDWFAARSLHIYEPDQLHAVFLGNPVTNSATRVYHRALDDIIKMDSADVVRNYPAFTGHAAQRLGEATTREDAHQVFADIFGLANTIDIINGGAILPSRTLLGARVTDMRDAIAKWGDGPRGQQANWFIPKRVIKADEVMGPDGHTVMSVGAEDQGKWVLPVIMNPLNLPSALSKTVRTFTGRAPFSITKGGELVDRRRIDLTNDAAEPALLDMFRMGMSESMAKEYLLAYQAMRHPLTGAPDLAGRRALVNGAQLETLKAMGLPDDEDLLEQVRQAFHSHANGWTDGSPSRQYGEGYETGDNVSKLDDGTGTFPAALRAYQDDRHITLLDFYAARRAVGDLHKVTGKLGALNDYYRRGFIEQVFKPLALSTGGFGLRVSGSELLQTMMRYGTVNTLRAMVAGSAARLNYKLLTAEDDGVDETDHVLASVAHTVAGTGAASRLREPTAEEKRAVVDQAMNPEVSQVGTGPSATEKLANRYGEQVMSKIGNRASFRLSNTVDPDMTQLAIDMTLRHGGHVPVNAVRTGSHGSGWADIDNKGIAQEVAYINGDRAARAAGQEYADGKLAWHASPNFTIWHPESAQFNMHWLTTVNKEVNDLQARNIAGDVLAYMREHGLEGEHGDSPGMRDAWRDAVDRDAARIAGYHYDPANPQGYGAKLDPADDAYAAFRGDMARRNVQDPQQWAFNRADDLRNTLTGRDGTFHGDLAERIAGGKTIDMRVIDRKDPLSRPKGLAGPEWTPYILGNLYKRTVQRGFKVLDGIINSVSRSPLYLVAVKRELDKLEYLRVTGKIDYERALGIAEHRAMHAMLPQIHNTANRSQLAMAATTLFPFWFAQEQAYRRVGRLAWDNPASVRYYSIIENGLTNGGFTTTDANGHHYLSFPGVGAAGQAAVNALAWLGVPLVSGLPMGVSGSLTSLQSVLPESNLPGVSPLVAVAANALTSFDPTLARYMGAIVGEQNVHASYIDQLIPNSPARSALKAVLAPEGDRAYQAAVLNALASAYYHGQMPGPDASVQERQAFADRIKNNARSAFMLKAILGVVSPLAPQVEIGDPGFRKEFNDMVTKYGDYGVALDHFLSEHGNSAISYTIGQTQATDAKIPYTDESIKWIEEHQDLTRDFPVAAAMLVPQMGATGDVGAIGDELLKMHLREVRSPDQFMDAIYIAAGNRMLGPAIDTHQRNLAGAVNNPQAKAAENTAWSQFIQTQRLGNPTWYDNYTSDSRRTTALEGLGQLMSLAQQRPDLFSDGYGSAINALLKGFMNHLGIQAQLHQVSAQSGSVGKERDNWTAYLNSLSGWTDFDGNVHAGTNPELATIIRTIFLPLAAQNIDTSLLQNSQAA